MDRAATFAWFERQTRGRTWDDVYHLGIPVYASVPPQGASIKLGSATLKLSFLKHTVSK